MPKGPRWEGGLNEDASGRPASDRHPHPRDSSSMVPAGRRSECLCTEWRTGPHYRTTIGPTILNGRRSITSPSYGCMQTIACLPGDIVVTALPVLLAGMTSLDR